MNLRVPKSMQITKFDINCGILLGTFMGGLKIIIIIII